MAENDDQVAQNTPLNPLIMRNIAIGCLVAGIGLMVFAVVAFLQEPVKPEPIEYFHEHGVAGSVIALFGLERFVSPAWQLRLRMLSALLILSLLIAWWL